MKNLLILTLFFTFTHNTFANANTACDQDSTYPEITLTELKTALEQKNVFPIDVNSADSYKKNHVPGALHFGATKAKQLASALPPNKNMLLVAYCGGPQCTAWKKAAKAACNLGYTNIKHFKEGIKGWSAASGS